MGTMTTSTENHRNEASRPCRRRLGPRSWAKALARIAAGSALFASAAHAATELTEPERFFLDLNCYECHNDTEKKGGLDLEHLSFDPENPNSMKMWAIIHDRVRDNEMPPKDELMPEEGERADFLGTFENTLHTLSEDKLNALGRVRSRRLNRIEYENTLHDLLGIDIPLASYLPEDPEQNGFTNVAEAQQISYHLLEKYLEAADAALDESFDRALNPAPLKTRRFTAQEIAQGRNRVGNAREPFAIGEHAVSYSTGLSYHGRMQATKTPEDGWYRISFKAHAVNAPEGHGVWTSVRSGICYAVAPLMYWIGSFEARAEPQEFAFDAWIQKDHLLEIHPVDRTLKRISGKSITDGNAPDLKGPGVAFTDLEIERIQIGPPPSELRDQLFGALPYRKGDFASSQPKKDIAKQMTAFAQRAFRQPVGQKELAPYLAFATQAYEAKPSIKGALRAGYRALLCSPRFLYFNEALGTLDSYAIASRLSYFLWNRMPDDPLMALAQQGRLTQPEVIRQQVERLLEDPRSNAFIEGFADHWLELKEIDTTSPDEKLYPEYDEALKNAMLGETRSFLHEMLRNDLSVTHIIDSDFAMLNERLARHYGIEGVSGTEFRRVPLKPEYRRGGIITHGSILKVTANGTTSSPVIRGVWMLERILGERMAPPPDDVPAVEPDIRGATSIRDQLEKHRSTKSCNACHVKIDPPGFALENYDVIGGWRTHYRALKGKRGPLVDAHYNLPNGRSFQDIEGFKAMILENPDQIARNLLEKTLIYATGASIEFADRREIDAMVEDLAPTSYGFRSLIHATVQSAIFLSK